MRSGKFGFFLFKNSVIDLIILYEVSFLKFFDLEMNKITKNIQ